MLKNLLKYDLLYNYKVLIIFYGLSLLFGLLTRIFLSIENSYLLNIIGQIASGVTISMFFNILINNLMRLWSRFKTNFYSDEAYLTHTLPVGKKTLYLAKVLSTTITLFTSVLVIGLTLFIAYYSKENILYIKNLLLPIANIYNNTIVKILFAFLFIFFLEFANLLQCGYTGIILGHQKDNNKVAYSVLFGFIAYFIVQMFVLLVIFIGALFNHDLMNLFITNEIVNLSLMNGIIYLTIGIYSLSLVIVYIVNLKLFQKGVNVD